uniref:Secreted protein n=1 Tax=Wuchereria bancrofti TaxID=6293 RepID=A0AAF5PUH5_WUCBA
MLSSSTTLSVVLMWCTYCKLNSAKRVQSSNNIQVSDALTENSAQRTEFVRTAWSAATYSKLRIYILSCTLTLHTGKSIR